MNLPDLGEHAEMKRNLSYEKNMDYDVILCKTYNELAGKNTCRYLMEHSISYSLSWLYVPFFLRNWSKGHKEVCVISVNRNDFFQARRSLRDLEERYRKRLIVNRVGA